MSAQNVEGAKEECKKKVNCSMFVDMKGMRDKRECPRDKCFEYCGNTPSFDQSLGCDILYIKSFYDGKKPWLIKAKYSVWYIVYNVLLYF